MEFILNFLGAAALLLWGLRMVRTGVLRAYGSELRHRLGAAMRNRFVALLTGLGVTCLLQSSSATALLASSFASRGMMTAGSALAIMLGADIGTSLVAQAYSFRVQWISPLLIIIGWVMFNKMQNTRVRDMGRVIIGLGIALLSLHLLTVAAEPVRDAPLVADILHVMNGAPLAGVLLGAILTLLSTSSVAVVLLIVTFATVGLVPIDLALSMTLGANVGSAILPIITTFSDAPEARRVPMGNLLFRAAGLAVALPLLPVLQPYLMQFQSGADRQVLNFHVLFNVALGVGFIGLIGPVARLTTRMLPDRVQPDDPSKPRYLNAAATETPAVALANAARETLRMGDTIAQMLRQSLQVFRADDRRLLKSVSELDTQLDRLNEAIKLYLTQASRDIIDTADQKRIVDLITLTTNLEHVGDIIDKNLMDLAGKKVRYNLKFSDEGWKEIETIFRRLNDNIELAMNVFMSGDITLARQLFAEKQVFRQLEKTAAENHFERLRSGRVESIATSSLHLDLLRDLKRINSHLALIAQPILEAAGELTPSRLKQSEA